MRVGEKPPKRARVEPPPSRRDEQRVVAARSRQPGARLVQVPRDPMSRLFPEGDGPLLAALPVDVDELLLEVDVAEVEVDRLATAQPGGIDELDKGAVAKSERAVALDAIQRRIDLVGAERLG